jgi:histidinol-phosphate aminotransferase
VQLGEGLRALGFETLPAHGNFIAFKTSRAKDIFDRLIERGIIIRPLDQYQLHDFLRVSVGRPEENQAFLAALADIVASFKQETAARQAA